MSTIGLDSLYYASITENASGDETYGTPEVLAKAIKCDLSVDLAEAILYADDAAAEVVKAFKEGKLSLGVDDIGIAKAKDLTGAEIDSHGVLVSSGEDLGNPVAVGFRALKANGKYRYFWLYRVKFTLCVDICKRNGKTKLIWFGDKDKTLNYTPKSNEMVLTVHRWFANKSCPGAWMYSRMGELASKVTAQLGTSTSSSAASSATQTTAKTTFKQGDVVKITGTSYYDGKSIPSWVLKKNWIVKSVNGNRVVIDKSEDGKNAICSPVKAADLKLVSSRKSIDEIAREVINGKWGNGTERKNRLTAAGYDYNAVQKRVNEFLKT